MTITTVTQYIESLSSPTGLFRTLGEPVCERDSRGRPVFFAGGNAAVFPISVDGKKYALKCYTRPRPDAADTCARFASFPSPLVAPSRFLPDEIYVYDTPSEGRWCDAILTEWIDGFSLDFRIRQAMRRSDAATLSHLADAFDATALALLDELWAHGDLKPSNIIVTPSGGMMLTDTDAAYFPGYTESNVRETGTPQYNHPLRSGLPPGKYADDYPIALLSATLHALADDMTVGRMCDREMQLMQPAEILAGISEGYAASRRLAARHGDIPLLAMLDLLVSPSPQLPGLRETLEYSLRFRSCPADLPATSSGIATGRNSDRTIPETFRSDAGKWGYRCGDRIVVPPVLDGALEFTESLAAINMCGVKHFIRTDGTTAINCSGYESIKPFRSGRAEVRRNGKTLVIDRHGAEYPDKVPDGSECT